MPGMSFSHFNTRKPNPHNNHAADNAVQIGNNAIDEIRTSRIR